MFVRSRFTEHIYSVDETYKNSKNYIEVTSEEYIKYRLEFRLGIDYMSVDQSTKEQIIIRSDRKLEIGEIVRVDDKSLKITKIIDENGEDYETCKNQTIKYHI